MWIEEKLMFISHKHGNFLPGPFPEPSYDFNFSPFQVNFVEDADGYVTLVAYPPKSYERKFSMQRNESKTKRR